MDVGFDGISAFTWLRSCPEPRELIAYLLSTAIVLGSTASAFSPVLSLLLLSTKWKRLILILGLVVAGPLLFRPARVASVALVRPCFSMPYSCGMGDHCLVFFVSKTHTTGWVGQRNHRRRIHKSGGQRGERQRVSAVQLGYFPPRQVMNQLTLSYDNNPFQCFTLAGILIIPCQPC